MYKHNIYINDYSCLVISVDKNADYDLLLSNIVNQPMNRTLKSDAIVILLSKYDSWHRVDNNII